MCFEIGGQRAAKHHHPVFVAFGLTHDDDVALTVNVLQIPS